MNNYIIYTDGSCINNPNGPGSYAAIIYNEKIPTFISGYLPYTTNQRMEMTAVISALSYIPEKSTVTLCSDSAYVCNCINQQWYVNWRKNGWINSAKQPVANKDLWEKLLSLIESHESVKFIKVKGHSDNMFNNKCDQMCRDIIDFTNKVNATVINKKE